MNPVCLQYHESANFGDALALYLAKKLTSKPVQFVTQSFQEPHYVICGSIISGSNEHSIIWGAGLSQFNEYVPKNKEILMVRGKLTRDTIKSFGYGCPDIFCDSGLLISKLYRPVGIIKKHKVGIMAHWVDYEKCKDDYGTNPDINIINLLEDTETVINEMLSCERILSSSLHGLIAANSYGLPALWCEFSNNVYGRGFKFWDYFTSINVPFHQAIDLRSKSDIENIAKKAYIVDIPIDLDKIIKYCPLNK